jgi:predicted enzyme related to lactoylglutathione lyase
MTNPSASSALGKFIWYDQMSNDLPGAEKFYSKVVGWTIAPNTMNAQRYSLLKAGETMVGGLMPIPEEGAKMGVRPAWMGYIAVDDVKAYADRVTAAGGVIHRPPTESPMSGPSPSPAIRAAPPSCCSRGTALRPRRRIR